MSDKFIFGYWQDLEMLQDKVKYKVDRFLKSIFMDDMDQKHIDKVMSEKETLSLLVCGYKIDHEDVDIFSCISFVYLDKDNVKSQTGIVYIATSPMFGGLSLELSMLCIQSQLLLCKSCDMTLIISTPPSNEK